MSFAPALRGATVRALHFALREPWLRLITPRSLFGRSMLIVMLPLLILQAMLAWVFYERHWDTVTRWLANGVAGDVAALVEMIGQARTELERQEALDFARRHFEFGVSLEPLGDLAATAAVLAPVGELEETLYENFERRIDVPFAVDTRRADTPRRIAIYVQLDQGLLRILTARKRVDSSTTTLFITWMVGLSVLLLVLSVYFLSRQVRPIRRLAGAADNFGKGRDVGDFRLEGASEIRQAGAAFNLMRKRILRHITQRTEMLAAVSHDLRTPLTRMRLELAMLGEGQPEASDIDGLKGDIDEMVGVIDGYLAFARGEGTETIEMTDLGPLLQDVVDRSQPGPAWVTLEIERPIVLPLRPVAFRRCITNIVDNASRYARAVAIRATMEYGQVWIAVDDNGPGIPPADREEVFRPFHRLEGSRNPGTGGVGLGLTIARDIVLGLGGDIELTDAPDGGLRVLIRLPR